MLENMIRTKGLIFSGRVLDALMKKGLGRTAAYDIVQSNAMKAWQQNADFKELLARDPRVKRFFSGEELEACFMLDYYLRNIHTIFKRVGL